MATTQKGIYYNDDYSSAADILEDERLMAQSIEIALESSDAEIANKVDKVPGKNLSTYDFNGTYKQQVDENTLERHTHSNKSVLDNTTASFETSEKTKLSGIATGAQVNVIETVKVNGTAKTVTDKAVDITVPTKVSDLANDSGFGTYTKPSGGIPKTDLASDVQTSLGKADTAIQSHQDITGKEDKSNKVTELTSESTNTQYPGAKVVYDELTDLKQRLKDAEDNQIELDATPGQSIYITDSASAKNRRIGITGNTEQYSTTGKQLLNCSNPLAVTTQQDVNCELPIGTYTISCSKAETTGTTSYMIQTIYEDDTSGYFSMGKTSLKGTFTTTGITKKIRIYSQDSYNHSSGITTTFYDLMLNTGSTAEPWEQYTGRTNFTKSIISTNNI